MKRAERRWKTKCVHEKRAKRFAHNGWFRYGQDKDGNWVSNRSKADTVEYIKECQYSLLEDPRICSCMLCSARNGYTAKPAKRRMRDGECKAIREFYKLDV